MRIPSSAAPALCLVVHARYSAGMRPRPDAREGALDWNDVRFFLAVAQHGTLAKAALALGVDQTTVGRRIASFEERLRVSLFARCPRGLTLTAAGGRVLDAAERMREAAVDVWSEAATETAPTAGIVRVATTHSLARAFVVPAIRDLRERYPAIQVILASEWRRVDLRAGDADVAVRLVRPTDPRLACKKLGDFGFRFYASREWVARNGVPREPGAHAVVVYDASMRGDVPPVFNNVPINDAQIALQTNSGDTLVAAVAAGLGIAELPSYVGDRHPQLVRVLPDHEHRYSVWLVVAQARRRVAVVRAVCDAITRAFTAGAPPSRSPARADHSPRTARRRR